MHIALRRDFVEEVLSNKFLRIHLFRFAIAQEKGEEEKFLQENPELMQMMYNYSTDDRILILNDEELEKMKDDVV